MALVADAIAPGATPDTLVVEQALQRGARRRVVLKTPVVVTVHPSASPPLSFAYGRMRRGTISADTAPTRGELRIAPLACEEKRIARARRCSRVPMPA